MEGGVMKTSPRPLLPPWKRPGTISIAAWLGPKDDLDGFGKSPPQWGSNPQTVQLVRRIYTDRAVFGR